MKNILVPTDFSNEAYNALFYATQMLASKACTFHILNSYTETTPLRSRRIAKREGKALIRQLSDESMEGLRSTCHRIKLDTHTTHHQFHIISRN
ncbi:MAG: universal stress protein, partial [Bacteroidota bacterium]